MIPIYNFEGELLGLVTEDEFEEIFISYWLLIAATLVSGIELRF